MLVPPEKEVLRISDPKGLLDFAPYPGAVDQGRMAGRNESGHSTLTLCLATPDPADKVYAHYLSTLPAAGWTLEAGDLGPVKAISFHREERRGTLTITAEKTETNILINLERCEKP